MKRVFTFALCLVMLFAAMPFSVLAADIERPRVTGVSMSIGADFAIHFHISAPEGVSEVGAYIEEHRVKATGPSDLAKSLSGGNQQKVVLGREVDIGTKLLMFNQPIRGLDMGAVDRIHKVILKEQKEGKAILLISTELTEIFELCNRIAVMYKGKFMGIYENNELDTEKIGLLMAGISEQEVTEE